MGVIREAGDWRLVDRGGDVYEITYQHETVEQLHLVETQEEVIDAHMSTNRSTLQVHSEAEAIEEFEDRIADRRTGEPDPEAPAVAGKGLAGQDASSMNIDSDSIDAEPMTPDESEDAEGPILPPGGFALAMVVIGVFLLWTSGFDATSLPFQLGGVALFLGIAVVAWAIIRTEDLREAVMYLTNEIARSKNAGRHDLQQPEE
jgi:hypothetical protein